MTRLAVESERWRPDSFVEAGLISFYLFIAFFVNLWGVPLFDLDEGAFAEATREMLLSGNFAATYLDGEPRYDKPILSYWLQSLSVSAFGIHEFAFRLPSALAASLWLVASYRFVKQEWDEQSALLTVAIMANVAIVGVIGRAATADAWLNLFISLTMFDMWRYMRLPQVRTLLTTYTWLALGVLTKGPVAIAIPLMAGGLFFTTTHQRKQFWKAVVNPMGWLVFAAILGPWLIAVYQDQGLGFFAGFLLDHNINRFTQTREGHGGSLLYYFVALPIIVLPFTGVLFTFLRRLRVFWSDALSRYLLLWFGVVFALVSMSKTQLPHYLLYGLTGVFFIFARYRDMLFSGTWQLLFPVGFMVLMFFLPDLVSLAADQSTRAYEADLLSRGHEVLNFNYRLLAALTCVAMVILAVVLRASQTYRLIALGVLQTLFIFNVFIDAVGELQQGPVKRAAELASQLGHDKVVAYGISMPSFSVYRQAVTPREAPGEADLIFTRADRLESLRRELREDLNIIFREGGIVLVERQYESQ
ncbi:MAG TPA: hypothetical protein DEX20_02920 [Halieaceae bacterium]|nr:hypothetical protein [Halieaceae bacterium]